MQPHWLPVFIFDYQLAYFVISPHKNFCNRLNVESDLPDQLGS